MFSYWVSLVDHPGVQSDPADNAFVITVTCEIDETDFKIPEIEDQLYDVDVETGDLEVVFTPFSSISADNCL